MVTANQALLKIRNQVVPNNMVKHLCNADALEKYLREKIFKWTAVTYRDDIDWKLILYWRL
jgi:hypothetical protein